MKNYKKSLTAFKRNKLSGAATIKGGTTKRLGMLQYPELKLVKG